MVVFAVGLGVFALVAGSVGLDLNRGVRLGILTFVFFFVIAAYLFFKIENWGYLPIIASIVYTILPDLILGPEDDILALILGALISGIWAWRTSKRGNPAKLID